jgi:tetratricopeptide (TPR) repeat protein
MEFGWLLRDGAGLLGALSPWLGWPSLGLLLALAVIGFACLVVAGLVIGRRRRHEAQAQSERVRSTAMSLKEQLRRRLSEPPVLFAGVANVAPTMGASEAFESDIEAAAHTVLIEAGGHRAKAKQLLRSRMHGQPDVGGKLNGGEASCWRQLGALALLDGSDDALAAYARAADLAPESADAQMLAGVLHLRAGNLSAAEAAFRRQVALGKSGNGSTDGAVARYRGNTMLGDVLAARDDHAGAMDAYTAAQQEVKGLLERDAASVALKRDLSVTCDRIGDMHAAKGDIAGALACYRQSLEIAEELAKGDPASMVWQHDLSVSYDRIGDLLVKAGDPAAALERFRKGLDIAKTLVQHDPENVQWQWDLSASHDRIGDVLIAEGKLDEAVASYGRSLAIAEALVKRDPGHPGWQRDLAVSYHKIGSLEALNNPGEAREHLEKGRAIIDRLLRIAAHQAQWRSDLAQFDEVLRTLDT